MSKEESAKKKDARSGLLGRFIDNWRSMSGASKVAVIGSWVGIAVVLGLSLFLSQGTEVPTLVFYGVLIAVGVLTGVPAYRLAKRPRVVVPVKQKPAPAPVAESQLIEPEEEPGILSKLSLLLAKPVSPRTRVYVVVASALLTLSLVLFATFVYPTFVKRPDYDNFMIATLVVGLIPPSFVDIIDRRYRTMIDMRIPDFLREIGEAQRTGTTFTKSLVNASQSNYGPLSVELRKAMSKMSWGMTFEESLDYFARNVDTPLAHRAAVLLKEVGRSGGKMLEVLDSVYEHVREVISLQKERGKQLTPYVAVIYASFGVYLFVVYILFSTFFAQVSHLQASGAPFGSNVNAGVYYIWFFHMSVLEGVFGGMVIGKITSGSSIAGMKHVLVLLAVSLIFFSLFVKY